VGQDSQIRKGGGTGGGATFATNQGPGGNAISAQASSSQAIYKTNTLD